MTDDLSGDKELVGDTLLEPEDKRDLVNVLDNYGGPTLTLDLFPGSPAIDEGYDCDLVRVIDHPPLVIYPTPLKAGDDQRGFPRGIFGMCDAGAVEFKPLTGDLDGDADVDQEDVDLLMQSLIDMGRCCDVDRDGQVTMLDARKLVSLCTRPRCSTS